MSDVGKEWRAHLAAGFPPAARGQEVNGVDLVLVDTYAAGCIQTFVDTGGLDSKRMQALRGCVEQLQRAVPLLGADTSGYFKRLLGLSRTVLASASDGGPLCDGKTV